jgi:hypothetical protein
MAIFDDHLDNCWKTFFHKNLYFYYLEKCRKSLGDALNQPVRLAYQTPASSTQNKPATSNQPAVLFSQNKPAPASSHQPTEQAENR